MGLKEFKVLTDHKPLVPLFNKRDLDKVPIRCQRLLLRMLQFSAVVQYVPEKEQLVADALSRKPAHNEISDLELADDMQTHMEAIEHGWPASPGKRLSHRYTD